MEKKKKRNLGGRPTLRFDRVEFEKLCGLQCTLEEIAGFMDTQPLAIERWCKREYGKPFNKVFTEKREGGKVSLRRMQWVLASKSAAMAIFLGKNYLGQSDRRDLQLSGEVKTTTVADLLLEGYENVAHQNKENPEDNRPD